MASKENSDLEWYVMSEAGKPKRIIVSRRDAIYTMSHDFKLTQSERRELNMCWELGMKIGEQLLVTGYERKPDRILTRVASPLIK